MTTNPQLETLLARFPKNRQHDVKLAYELGLGDLEAALAKKPQLTHHGYQKPGRINDFPAPFVHLLNTIIKARGVDICFDFALEALSKDERRLVKDFKPHLHRFLHNMLTALTSRNLVKPQNGESPLTAAKQYSYEMADLDYECLHELNNNADPREPLAAMRVFNALGLIAADDDVQPEMKAA